MVDAPIAGGDLQRLRQLNSLTVLRTLRQGGSMTISKLAQQSGLGVGREPAFDGRRLAPPRHGF